MGFLRVFALLFFVLLAVYAVLSVWMRLAHRRHLAGEWERGAAQGDREDFMAAGMAAFDRSLRSRLLWLVIIAPMAGFALLLYLLNIA